jgi:hypothetical protein
LAGGFFAAAVLAAAAGVLLWTASPAFVVSAVADAAPSPATVAEPVVFVAAGVFAAGFGFAAAAVGFGVVAFGFAGALAAGFGFAGGTLAAGGVGLAAVVLAVVVAAGLRAAALGFAGGLGFAAAFVGAVADFGAPASPGFGAPEVAARPRGLAAGRERVAVPDAEAFVRAVFVAPDVERPDFVPPARPVRGFAGGAAVAGAAASGAGGGTVASSSPPRRRFAIPPTAVFPTPVTVSMMSLGLRAIWESFPQAGVPTRAVRRIAAGDRDRFRGAQPQHGRPAGQVELAPGAAQPRIVLGVQLVGAVDGRLSPLPHGVDLGLDLRRRPGRELVGAGHQEADSLQEGTRCIPSIVP